MSQTGAMAVRDLAAEGRPPVRAVYWDFVSNAALLRVLALATTGLLAVALWMALFYAPRELMMGDAQRISTSTSPARGSASSRSLSCSSRVSCFCARAKGAGTRSPWRLPR